MSTGAALGLHWEELGPVLGDELGKHYRDELGPALGPALGPTTQHWAVVETLGNTREHSDRLRGLQSWVRHSVALGQR
jgi:hypothetical protein